MHVCSYIYIYTRFSTSLNTDGNEAITLRLWADRRISGIPGAFERRAYIYVSTYILYIYTCIHTCMNAYTHTCMYVCIYIYTCTCTCTHTHTHTHTRKHTHVYIYVAFVVFTSHIHTHQHTHIYMHKHKHIHSYAHDLFMCLSFGLSLTFGRHWHADFSFSYVC